MITQIEGGKLTDKIIKEQLDKLKDNEIHTTLDILWRSSDNRNDNKNNFPPNIPPDFCLNILLLLPADSPTLPLPPPLPFPPFSPQPPTFPLQPPTDFFGMLNDVVDNMPAPSYCTKFVEKIVLADFVSKIATVKKTQITIMPKVQEIPNTAGKKNFPMNLINFSRSTINIWERKNSGRDKNRISSAEIHGNYGRP